MVSSRYIRPHQTHDFDDEPSPLLLAQTLSGKPRKLSALESCVISGIAPAFAVVFTNPFDTAKVRLQLQGELVRQAGLAARAGAAAPAPRTVYRNSLDCLVKTFRHEGLVGLEKGLTPAVLREGSKNVFRLGLFDPVMHALHPDTTTSAPAWKRMVAGAVCGAAGALACNPFELVKTRLQSAAADGLAVGHQHHYSGVRDAFRQIVRESGVPGLYRGSMLSVVRSIGGSATNLTAFSMSKEALMARHGWGDTTVTDMVCGLTSGIASCIAMNPVDVTRTRYYNQPTENGRGLLYRSGWHAAQTILANEGPQAFYKGFTSHFLRIGPHFCLSFLFLGILRRNLIDYYDQVDMMHSFYNCDRDHDGQLNLGEVTAAMRSVVPHRNLPKLSDAEYDRLMGKYAARVMAKVDVRHTGVVDFDAFAEMTREVRQILRENNTRRAFAAFDRDGNGRIDVQDLTLVLRELRPAVAASAAIAMAPDEYDAFLARSAGQIIRAGRAPGAGASYITLEQFEKMADGLSEVSQHVMLEKWIKSAGLTAH